MRSHRAYIAGLGTTAVLIGSALLLLAVVSTLVAFKGWPGIGGAEDLRGLLVDEGTVSVRVEEPDPAAADTSPRSTADTSAPSAGSPAPPVPARALAGASPAVSDPGGGGIGTAPGVGTDVPTLGPVRPPELRPPPPITSPATSSDPGILPDIPAMRGLAPVANELADTTESLTGNVGGTVDTLTPALGDTVTETGELLSEIIRNLGEG